MSVGWWKKLFTGRIFIMMVSLPRLFRQAEEFKECYYFETIKFSVASKDYAESSGSA